jgi:hypothetical protein
MSYFNNDIDWGWQYLVYLIQQVHPKFYNIGKRFEIEKTNLLSTSSFFLNKDHQLAYFNILVPCFFLSMGFFFNHCIFIFF